MKTVVIYSKEDLEPISVIKLPCSVEEVRRKYGHFLKIPISQRVSMSPISECTVPDNVTAPVVTLEFVDFIYEGMKKTFIVTGDEGSCLLLRSNLLAGQRKDWFEKQFNDFIT